MIELFRENLSQSGLVKPGNRIILAVSGGIDSIVMATLFREMDFEILVAHCNFGLRGTESDEDEIFVRSFCDKNNLRLTTRRFETKKYSEENGISIQMAARELRYKWFEEVRINNGFDFIATAHNLDDQVETFFINLSRGTGIRGLTGISFHIASIIRPLIFYTRKEILDYARSQNTQWREDSSNSSLKYSRNKIRHGIIPLFRELNPSFERTMGENIRKINMAQEIYLQYIELKRKKIVLQKEGYNTVSIPTILMEEFGEAILYEILTAFNFTPGVIEDVWKSLHSEPGKKFFSETHRLIKDREFLIIEAFKEIEERKYYIESDQERIFEPLAMKLQKIPQADYVIPESPGIGSFDFDLIDFPLIIRKWHAGDYFYPLGMNNPKKLSDFFIDEKFSILQKEHTWLLCSGQDIIWVIGHRIDNRFKISEKTENILRVSLV